MLTRASQDEDESTPMEEGGAAEVHEPGIRVLQEDAETGSADEDEDGDKDDDDDDQPTPAENKKKFSSQKEGDEEAGGLSAEAKGVADMAATLAPTVSLLLVLMQSF